VLLTGAVATQVDGRFVRLQDGTTLAGDLVVDARGPDLYSRAGSPGFQKFLGVEFDVDSPAPFTRPLLMDARVPQLDGFRFFYVLPFSQHRVLVEDTYFSDSADLDVCALRARVFEYAKRAGLAVRSVVREETGVLPLPTKSPAAPEARSPLLAGYAGGWFHPGTGYSFPVGLRLAAHLARSKKGEEFGPSFAALVAGHRRQFRYATFLNRMMFGAFDPEQRFNVLERFYRLPEETIGRFYALETTAGDRLRILCGRPPRGMRLPWKAPVHAPLRPDHSNLNKEGLSR
jgi:lycopene beta-cyclase